MYFDPAIFKHPAVEYIPLYPETLALNPYWTEKSTERVSLYVFQDQEALAEELRLLRLDPATQVNFAQDLALLTLGYQVNYAYYRGYATFLLGNPLPGGYHLSRITRRYFYKDRIHFALYSGKAEKLAWANIALKSL